MSDEEKPVKEETVAPPVVENIAKLTEFETKYRVDPSVLTEFKRIVDMLPNLKNFFYIEGPDDYFTNGHIIKAFSDFGNTLKEKEKEILNKLIEETIGLFPPFMRYRRPSHGLDNNRQELTTKYKQDGSKNNIIREEKNIRVDSTEVATVNAFVNDLGYKLNFSIWKTCHIYKFDDATLVFYSVYDTTDGKASKMDNFVEIEVSEEKISEMNESQAWEIVQKYEKALEDIGLTPQKRLKRSLFEMYHRPSK